MSLYACLSAYVCLCISLVRNCLSLSVFVCLSLFIFICLLLYVCLCPLPLSVYFGLSVFVCLPLSDCLRLSVFVCMSLSVRLFLYTCFCRYHSVACPISTKSEVSSFFDVWTWMAIN